MRSAAVIVAVAVALTVAAPAAGQGRQPVVLVTDLEGTIGPAASTWVDDAIASAADRDAMLLVLRLDTPGGLDTSMREIIKRIIGAPVPVAVWIAPSGARAASAGMYITLAGHVAAMAPQTNIGSATPVSLGPAGDDEVLGRKVRNDAAAYAAALAEGRGRDAALAEQMVRDATNVPASEARDRGLIDLIAGDVRTLVREVDGRRIVGPAPTRVLRTEDASVERLDVPVLVEIQRVLFNPNVAFLLLLAGFAGIVVEVFSPGLLGPGLFGVVALVLGLYGTAQLPVTAAGVALLLVGIGFLVAELAVASGGMLGVAGAISLVAAGLLLFDDEAGLVEVSVPVAAAVGASTAAFTLFAASKALAARSAPPRGGARDLVGDIGTVRTPLSPIGHVYVGGALWRAEQRSGARGVEVGARVRVQDVHGLTIVVEPLEEDS